MNVQIKKIIKFIILFLIYGCIYCGIELLYRGRTHPSMFLLGGVCAYLIGILNENIEWNMPVVLQALLGGCIVTIGEFVFGLIFNVWLGLNVWDYSNLPFNIMGQICLPFTCIWCLLSMVTIFVDDWIRYILFHEEKPHYTMF